MRIVAKTAPMRQWEVARELRARVKSALDAAGAVISTTDEATSREPGHPTAGGSDAASTPNRGSARGRSPVGGGGDLGRGRGRARLSFQA